MTAGRDKTINNIESDIMDKEKLNKAITIRRMLDTDLNAVSRVFDTSDSVFGESLKSIVINDEEFRTKYMQLVHDTYDRLKKEFDEL